MAASLPSNRDRMHANLFNADDEAADRASDHVEMLLSGVPSFSVESRFLVSPRHADEWIETWSALAALAGAWPGCRHFRLTRDHNDSMYFVIYSEWEDATAYILFAEEARVQALEQALASISFPEEARVLDIIPVGPKTVRKTQHDA